MYVSIGTDMSNVMSKLEDDFFELLIYMCKHNILHVFSFFMQYCEYRYQHEDPSHAYTLPIIYTDLRKLFLYNNPKYLFFNDLEKIRPVLGDVLHHIESFMDERHIPYDFLQEWITEQI